MTFTVALVGRPNVGKSTLFNRLVGKRLALVDDTPGVTRDRREGQGSIGPMRFRVIDTAGLEEAFDDSMEARMRRQTEAALDEADVAVLMIDARAGVTPLDKHFANWLRTRNRPVVVVANKCEGKAGAPGLYESFGLGLGEPIPISAEHGEGMGDLYDALEPFDHEEVEPYVKPGSDTEILEIEDDGEKEYAGPLQLAIVGRPNVGKSTLINRLLGQDRMLTGPEAGITRDSIAVSWSFRHKGKDREIKLVDTAGLRKRARVQEKLEKLSTADTLRAVRFAQVVVLMLDADAVLEKQDLTIARLVINEGRALVIAVNKWDAVTDREATINRLNDRLQTSLPQVRGIPVVTFSALRGKGVDKLLPAVMKAYDIWNTRISTSPLNRWLADLVEHHPPPLVNGRRLKLRYMTQAKTRPPTFVIFASKPEELPETYSRYLINGLRETFKLAGVPIRILTRKGNNPFAKG